MKPTSEADVVDLFRVTQDYLHWHIKFLQIGFPDAIIENDHGQCLVVEFERRARNFKFHKHDPIGCDLIICWDNNWPESPLPVWSLKDCLPSPSKKIWALIADYRISVLEKRVADEKEALLRKRAMDSLRKFMDNTEEPVIQKHKRGRPAKPGRRIFVGIFLREGEDDKTIKRLAELPEGKRSAYIRRVLSGAPVEVHDSALAVESETVRAGLDAMAGAWEEE